MTLTIQQHGEGDKARTTGLPWNPMAALRLVRCVKLRASRQTLVLQPDTSSYAKTF